MRTLNKGGYAILSGMLLEQAADVLGVYENARRNPSHPP